MDIDPGEFQNFNDELIYVDASNIQEKYEDIKDSLSQIFLNEAIRNNPEISVAISKKGNPVLIYQGNYYLQAKICDNQIYYKCRNKYCPGRGVLTSTTFRCTKEHIDCNSHILRNYIFLFSVLLNFLDSYTPKLKKTPSVSKASVSLLSSQEFIDSLKHGEVTPSRLNGTNTFTTLLTTQAIENDPELSASVSRKGNPILTYRGHSYLQTKIESDHIYYKCRNKTCLGRGILTADSFRCTKSHKKNCFPSVKSLSYGMETVPDSSSSETDSLASDIEDFDFDKLKGIDLDAEKEAILSGKRPQPIILIPKIDTLIYDLCDFYDEENYLFPNVEIKTEHPIIEGGYPCMNDVTNSPMVYLRSKKVRDLVYHDNYLYRFHRVRGPKVDYKCRNKYCPSRAIKCYNRFIVTRAHNHESERAKFLALQTKNLFKEAVKANPHQSLKETYEQVLRERAFPPDIHDYPGVIPSFNSIGRAMGRARSRTLPKKEPDPEEALRRAPATLEQLSGTEDLLQYVRSERGQAMIYCKNYLYAFHRSRGNKRDYKCRDRRCNSRAIFSNGVLRVTLGHNHPEDRESFLVLETRNKLKDAVYANPYQTSKQTYYQVLSERRNVQDIYRYPRAIPLFESVERTMDRALKAARAKALPLTLDTILFPEFK